MQPVRKLFLTGASSGIGQALAEHYAAQGALLGLVARRAMPLQALATRWPGQISCYPLDVTDAAALRAAADDFIGRLGVPDIVIANAGVSVGTLTEHPEDLAVIRQVMDTNLYGMAATFSPFIGGMRRAGRGRLVGIASVAGIRGLPGSAAYSASKAAAISYLESLRVELRASGISVLTICPGYIATPMTERNPFPMPFLIPADVAAVRFAQAIARRRSYVVIPWQMGIVGKLLRLLPNAVYDRLLAGAPRKPRRP
ncbi:MAG: SDR family oxidoreductase [Candidatus Accumulibacter sp.]|uniref:SDR family oxidoreductase n=1 Tax=Accumulibacter sp. TaxID=2053492 RepID=UPI001E18F1EA|nr:SDR family oxidoreductase [Accumulibacter sp.]MCB1941348.1 SDR family oxidoreductase [Accumulibacter sp.]MCP5248367.1 SDR family oxidoreductase [Accumulibacter sp.]